MNEEEDSNQPFRVREGDNVVIECVASGQPKPTYSWYSTNGKAIRLRNNNREYIESFPISWWARRKTFSPVRILRWKIVNIACVSMCVVSVQMILHVPEIISDHGQHPVGTEDRDFLCHHQLNSIPRINTHTRENTGRKLGQIDEKLAEKVQWFDHLWWSTHSKTHTSLVIRWSKNETEIINID